MSLRGELISKEYQNMVWVRDKKGAEFICYSSDLKSRDHVSEDENISVSNPVRFSDRIGDTNYSVTDLRLALTHLAWLQFHRPC